MTSRVSRLDLPDPGIIPTDEKRRDALLRMLDDSKVILAEPRGSERVQGTNERLSKTFAFQDGPGGKSKGKGYLPAWLKGKIKIVNKGCMLNGCRVDVTYPDWKTFCAVDEAVLSANPPSPFMTHPGPRYRTGRVKVGDEVVASWILAYRPQDIYATEKQPEQKGVQ